MKIWKLMGFGLSMVTTVAISACNKEDSSVSATVDGMLERYGYDDGSGERKIALCHIPPGNPGQAKWISVGAAALKAHVGRHGTSNQRDYIAKKPQYPEYTPGRACRPEACQGEPHEYEEEYEEMPEEPSNL
ncbi:MAG: hypothetical protein AB7P04_09780 [Bacteriovoracia bacterium]